MSNANSSKNKSKRIYCFLCDKWLNDKEFNLHRQLTFSYPHIFSECKINIGVLCEDKEHHPNVNYPSKYFCVTHGKHICSTCNEIYHSVNNNCFVCSLKEKKCQVNEFYKKILLEHKKKDNDKHKYNILQQRMQKVLLKKIIMNKNINISESIRKILAILFRTYFLISEKHYPNVNLAQSIINLDLSNFFSNTTNLNKNTQLITNTHSLNYVQTMNFFPKKYSVSNGNSNMFLLKSKKRQYDQFIFYQQDNIFIGEVKLLNENTSEIQQQKEEHTAGDQLILQNNDFDYDNNKKNYIINITNPKLSTTTTTLTQHIKCLSHNRLAVICSHYASDSNKELYLQVFYPVYSKSTSSIISYKSKENTQLSCIKLSNDFSNFIGICDYTHPSNKEFQYENETSFFCFENQILFITSNMEQPIEKNPITTFKEIFKKRRTDSDIFEKTASQLFLNIMPLKEDLSINRWKTFHHFIPFPINKFKYGHLLMVNEFLKEQIHTLYLAIEDAESNPNILAFIIEPHSTEIKCYNLTKTKSDSILSFTYLHKDYIALGGSNNTLEVYKITLHYSNYSNDIQICSSQQDSEYIQTYHQNGIHSINVINESFFITGGGNGEFIIWNINSLHMMNVVYDNERNNLPINKVLMFNCLLGKNTLVSCLNGKGVAIWINQSDVDDNER